MKKVKKMNRSVFLIILIMVCCATTLTAMESDKSEKFTQQNQSLDFFPFSPLIGIYAVHYTHKFDTKNALIFSPSYMKIQYEAIGHTNAPGIILGYRRYLWKNLHVDYQLMPMFDRFYEENEQKRYPWGFDLWNEFRLGYEFDFQIHDVPLFLNIQWPFGFALYSDPNAKPDSFKAKAEEEPLFYFPPLFFIGCRF